MINNIRHIFVCLCFGILFINTNQNAFSQAQLSFSTGLTPFSAIEVAGWRETTITDQGLAKVQLKAGISSDYIYWNNNTGFNTFGLSVAYEKLLEISSTGSFSQFKFMADIKLGNDFDSFTIYLIGSAGIARPIFNRLFFDQFRDYLSENGQGLKPVSTREDPPFGDRIIMTGNVGIGTNWRSYYFNASVNLPTKLPYILQYSANSTNKFDTEWLFREPARITLEFGYLLDF